MATEDHELAGAHGTIDRMTMTCTCGHSELVELGDVPFWIGNHRAVAGRSLLSDPEARERERWNRIADYFSRAVVDTSTSGLGLTRHAPLDRLLDALRAELAKSERVFAEDVLAFCERVLIKISVGDFDPRHEWWVRRWAQVANEFLPT